MEKLENLQKWLGITNQQLNIIEAMLSLERKRAKASPKAIIEEDATLRSLPKIQKSNFFAQLKTLRSVGYLKKTGSASYAVDFNSITKALDRAEAKVNREATELKTFKAESERRFKALAVPKELASVEFMDYNKAYSVVADIAKSKTNFYTAGPFPKVLYAHSPSLINQPDAQKYAQTLWMRCMVEQKLEITYATHFDIDYLFMKLSEAYSNTAVAYEEIKVLLNNIPNVLDKSKALNILYSESPSVLSMMVPYDEIVEEIFLPIRDTNFVGKGCVHIRSPELAIKFRQIFLDQCVKCVDMRSSKGERVLKKLDAKLDRRYQREGSKKHSART